MTVPNAAPNTPTLVERLRSATGGKGYMMVALLEQAADEIERLTRELQERTAERNRAKDEQRTIANNYERAIEIWKGRAAAAESLASSLQALERERCAKVCEAERVDAKATGEPEDHAYNQACEHCAAAIRSLAPQPPQDDAQQGEGMMELTPRTDELYRKYFPTWFDAYLAMLDHARQLERELSAKQQPDAQMRAFLHSDAQQAEERN